jgi:hypothetical protein
MMLGCYAAALLTLIAAAGWIALGVEDVERRADGYRVLKLAIAAATGACGVLTIAIKLHELGLMSGT